jgi:hypothetical protein
MNIQNFWLLDAAKQEKIRQEYPCDSEEEHQAFLNALFPPFETFEEADAAYDLTDTGNGGYLNW